MAEQVQVFAQRQGYAVNTVSALNVATNVVMGASLQYLWDMVNTLQFVIFMTEWRVNWPANVTITIKTLRTVALGELVEFDSVKKVVL